MIANTIIASALRKLLVIPSGGTPTANQYADGLELLNDMVNSWSGNGNLTYEDTAEELTIPANTQSITIGASGALVTGRPLEILTHNLKSSDIEYDLHTADSVVYSNFAYKSKVARPHWLHYRHSFPNGTFYFDSTTDQQYTLVLTSIKELPTFADGTTDVPLPAYYEHALKLNLMVEIAPEMGAAKRVTPMMAQQAVQAKNTIIGQSMDLQAAETEIGASGVYNIEGDSYSN